MLVGILPNKLGVSLKGLFETDNINSASARLKDFRFRVSGTRGWNEAEFTIGGINVNEVKPGTLASKLRKNVYFAGQGAGCQRQTRRLQSGLGLGVRVYRRANPKQMASFRCADQVSSPATAGRSR